jgi:hypothetical protein
MSFCFFILGGVLPFTLRNFSHMIDWIDANTKVLLSVFY